MVKPDGITTSIDVDGTIHATGGQTSSGYEPDNTTIDLVSGKLHAKTATVNTLGIMKPGSGCSVSADGTLTVPIPTVPVSDANTFGVVKPDGSSVTAENGVLTAHITGSLPIATQLAIGGVKVDGTSITVEGNGTIHATQQQYTLPQAASSVLGGVKAEALTGVSAPVKIATSTGILGVNVGSNSVLGVVKSDNTTTTIDADGTIHSNASFVLPKATTSVLGGVKSDGDTIEIDSDGVISVAGGSGYTLPTASTDTLGGVKVSGVLGSSSGSPVVIKSTDSTIHVKVADNTGTIGVMSVGTNNRDGKLSISTLGQTTANKATDDFCGVVKPDGETTTVDADGTIHSISGGYILPEAGPNTLGGVKITGSYGGTETRASVIADSNAEMRLSVLSAYNNELGVVAVGSGNRDGKISIAASTGIITADKATVANTGTVKPDDSTIKIDGDGTIHAMNNDYELPTASTSVLGGVKVDDSTTVVDEDGVLHAVAGYTLPAATANALGGIKANVLDGEIPNSQTITLDNAGVAKVTAAANGNLGVVKEDGTSTTIDADGTIHALGGSSYELPVATSAILGGVKVSETASGYSRAVSIDTDSTLKIGVATSNGALGVVKPDGTSTTIDIDGTIHASGANIPLASGTVLGGVKVEGTTSGNGMFTGLFMERDPYYESTYGMLYVRSAMANGSIGVVSCPTALSDGRISSNDDGAIHAVKATADYCGVVKPDNSTIYVNNAGAISAMNNGSPSNTHMEIPLNLSDSNLQSIFSTPATGWISLISNGTVGRIFLELFNSQSDAQDTVIPSSKGLMFADSGVGGEAAALSLPVSVGQYVKVSSTQSLENAHVFITYTNGVIPVTYHPDGSTITVDEDGKMSAVGGSGMPHSQVGETLTYPMTAFTGDQNYFIYESYIPIEDVPIEFEGYLSCYVSPTQFFVGDTSLRAAVSVEIQDYDYNFMWGNDGYYGGIIVPVVGGIAKVFIPKPSNTRVFVRSSYIDRNGSTTTYNPRFRVKKFI
jgi:flagellar basal body rod protein FlgF